LGFESFTTLETWDGEEVMRLFREALLMSRHAPLGLLGQVLR
jgi:hypothetical protein